MLYKYYYNEKVITVVEKSRENKELLAIESVDKNTIAKVAKIPSAIDLRSKHSWTINIADMNIAGDL